MHNQKKKKHNVLNAKLEMGFKMAKYYIKQQAMLFISRIVFNCWAVLYLSITYTSESHRFCIVLLCMTCGVWPTSLESIWAHCPPNSDNDGTLFLILRTLKALKTEKPWHAWQRMQRIPAQRILKHTLRSICGVFWLWKTFLPWTGCVRYVLSFYALLIRQLCILQGYNEQK